jgi:hypothetical protein
MNGQLILTVAEDGGCLDVEAGQTVVIQLKRGCGLLAPIIL